MWLAATQPRDSAFERVIGEMLFRRSMRLTRYERERIVRVVDSYPTYASAWRQLRHEGIKVDVNTVSNTWRRYAQTGTVAYRVPPGRPARLISLLSDYVETRMDDNNETTAGEISAMIYRDLGLKVSAATVKEIRRRMGWSNCSVKYAQMVRVQNRAPRVEYSIQITQGLRRFENVVFTDECSVQLECNRRRCFVKNGNRLMSIRSKAKHPLKVHVWAGISADGGTCLAIFDGKIRMDSKFYCKILKKCYLPFRESWIARHGTPCYLQHDNDPKHKSKYTTSWLESNAVEVIWWPAESPDLNPIECLWHLLKEFLRSVVKPTNKAELVAGVRRFWKERVTAELCRKYCAHIYNVAPLVIDSAGGPTMK